MLPAPGPLRGTRPAGDDVVRPAPLEDVVRELAPVLEVHRVGMDVDVIDGALDELDAVGELFVSWPDDVLVVGEAERYEQQGRLVQVVTVLVDHDDVDALVVDGMVAVVPVQAVGEQRAAGAAAEDDDPLLHGAFLSTPIQVLPYPRG